MKPILTAILLASIVWGAGAQTTQKLTAGKVNEYGLIYSLPDTRFNVILVAEQTLKKPGPFYEYAKKYLATDPILEESSEYKLTQVEVIPFGVTDPDERYLVQFKPGAVPFMVIDSQNAPLAVNTEQVTVPTQLVPPVPVSLQPTILDSPVAQQAMTAEMLQSTSTRKRAEFAAARIYEIREIRADILSGNAENMPSDGQAMKLVLDNLAQQEEALVAMFLGTAQTSTDVTVVEIIPGDTNPRKVLARLSMSDGFVATDDLSGSPIYADLTVTERGKLPVNEKGEEKRFPKGGLAYRIPGKAELQILYKGENKFRQTFDVAQYGVVFGIDPALFTDKKAPAYVKFNPLTGAITELGTLEQ